MQDQQLTNVILFNFKLFIICKISSFHKEHEPEECEKYTNQYCHQSLLIFRPFSWEEKDFVENILQACSENTPLSTSILYRFANSLAWNHVFQQSNLIVLIAKNIKLAEMLNSNIG